MKHIVFAIGSLHGGGAERVVSVWASKLAERGYRVSVIVFSRLEDEYNISDKVNVYPIADSQKACNDMSVLKRILIIRKLLKKLKPNVVISFLPMMQVYMRLAGVGLKYSRIETIRINPWRAEIVKSKLSGIWLGCFKKCNALILQSEDQRPFFSEKVQKKAVVIPNPINEKYLEVQKKEYNASSHKIVAAGRLSEQKNYKMMIDAVKLVLKKYDDVSLQIYGNGDLKDRLCEYIEGEGLSEHIRLMGRSNELFNVYRDADLYVMSSDYEGLPNALAEAMAVGLPCISTDCKTGPRDLIDDGENGFLVPCNDANTLAERIEYIFELSDGEQRRIGESARKKISAFCGEESSIEKLIALIERL